MMLDGVEVDDEVVRELAAVVDKPLAQKLERALFFRAEIVALTREEREAVAAVMSPPQWEPADVGDRVAAHSGWGQLVEPA